MSFPEQAESLRAKAHLSGARLPVLIGVTALALCMVVVALSGVARALFSDGFALQKNTEDAQVTPTVQGDQGVSEDKRPQAEAVAMVVVHVGGAVMQPGVCELAPGARVQDAVRAAGGFGPQADETALNLARLLVDGEQVVVPVQGEEQDATADAEQVGGAATVAGKLNINAASAAELEALPGIGPATARKIVADREAQGPFITIEDLKRVSGIGDKKYAALAEAICVG